MKSLVVVLAAALALAAAGPAPQPGPEPAPGPVGPLAPSGGNGGGNGGGANVADQESQASEAVSKRGAARLTPVSGNSIVDNTVSSAPQQQQQQQVLSYSSPAQQQLQQQQLQQQQPLYAPHPYSFVAPQPHPSFFQYQPALQSALPALPPLLHSKYHAPGKQHVLQYVPQPYFQMPQYQAPLMYIIPQPQPQQLHSQQLHAQQLHAQPQQQQSGPQSEQQAQQAQQAQPHHQQQPQYVMVLSAPAPGPVAASGFQYFNHPGLALQHQPQQLITFYAGPQQGQLHHQQGQLHHQQHQHQPQTRFYPEQQQLVFQSPQPEGSSIQSDGPPHFVQKSQQGQNPVGLEAPAPPTPASLVGSYGARVQQPQHTYKTIIKA